MKVFMTGGTGFVGKRLVEALAAKGHEVTVLTRRISGGETLPEGGTLLEGDPAEKGPWQESLSEHEVIINLAGASIFTRWTEEVKKTIRESRIQTTRNVAEALSHRRNRETLFLSTSAVGYYGFHGDEELDEGGLPGDDYLAVLAREWEREALGAEKHGIRVVLNRFGIVLGAGGGALGKMLPLFRWGLGSPLGGGGQWFSWIHAEDLVKIHLFLMEHPRLSGPFNCTAPYPVTNRELTKVLGQVLKRPTFMPPVPGFAIRMMMGEFGSVLLKGQRVFPKRLLECGYSFRFPRLREALEDILAR